MNYLDVLDYKKIKYRNTDDTGWTDEHRFFLL